MKLTRPILIALVANEIRGLCVVATVLAGMAHHAQAQNAPLSGLLPRGTVQPTDIIPILPAGGTQLMQTPVSAITAAVGGGTVTTVTCGAGLSGGTFTIVGTCAIAANGVTLVDMATLGPNTVLGNFTSGTANVLANPVPSCADTGGNHLNYVSGTGLTCGTSGVGSGGLAPNLLKFGPRPTWARRPLRLQPDTMIRSRPG